MSSRTGKSRKWLIFGGIAVVLAVGGAYGLATLKGASADVDPSRLATVERGTMVKSVVATGKVEPITKVEIKSKANGIIKKLNVDVDSAVNAGDVLVELDKEQLTAALRGARGEPAGGPRGARRRRGPAQEERRRGRRAGRGVRAARVRPRASRSSRRI